MLNETAFKMQIVLLLLEVDHAPIELIELSLQILQVELFVLAASEHL